MTYLAHSRHDVFVSYAHGPKYVGEDEPLGRWTRQLKSDLAAEIMIGLGTKDPKRKVFVWMDPRLAGNDPITDTLKDTVQQSATLVAVMSPFFLQGDWCRNEVKWFTEACAAQGGASGRIFVVRALETKEAAWPDTLRDSAGQVLKGYSFYPQATDIDEETRPFGWPMPNDRDQDYSAAVRRLASDITRRLKAIEAVNQPRPAVARSVFLGLMHDTVEVRGELRQKLTHAGLSVLPEEADDPVDEASLREQMGRHMEQCQALVMVANEHGTLWPRDQLGGALGLQLQRAEALKIPAYTWLQVADTATIRRPAYRGFVENLKAQPSLVLDHADVAGFVGHVSQGVSRKPDRQQTPMLESNAVICSNRPADEIIGTQFASTVRELLRETGRDNYTFDFADPKAEQIKLANLEKRPRDADTVLVLCFDQDWDWARPLLRQLNLLSFMRNGSKARMFLAGPRDMQEGLYDAMALGFNTIDVVNVGPDQLKDRLRTAMASYMPARGAAQGAETHARVQ
jgi:hypothetical protein